MTHPAVAALRDAFRWRQPRKHEDAIRAALVAAVEATDAANAEENAGVSDVEGIVARLLGEGEDAGERER